MIDIKKNSIRQIMLRRVSTNRTNFVNKKFIKKFRTNLIIVAVESTFVDEKNI